MIRALLFDMDGLIFDTEVLYKVSWQHAARQQGLELNDDLYRTFIGVQDSECERILSEHFRHLLDLRAFRTVRDQHFHRARSQGVTFKPGFHAVFQMAKHQGLTIALVTSSHRQEVERNFYQSDYLKQFDLIITAEDVLNGKPQPDCYLMACAQLGIKPSQCLVLEDSNNGMRAGKSAGCIAAMIPDMLLPDSDVKAEADYLFESLYDVLPLLS
ncbi:haloacid dehalogenase [Vibrio sp. 10N.286.49.C2]|uniref:HAD family hydrolase n=1 Tax=unclassified Vibrio TaxID=2614977 RepID=UPI000C81A9E4|nr:MULTISPECIES: HAD family phosphatase [unclassified Vibrio]PMH26462.1 haloacid dehalogenase [Vibrio sp. 10N.286.49.C2]PMH54814.1 haloacid dehalogenase [Vibrio sp. 10N.286.49.B1]PMH77636.1 haloacid dehalogenase [Vibrio sp. 10N.286.48.B7]